MQIWNLVTVMQQNLKIFKIQYGRPPYWKSFFLAITQQPIGQFQWKFAWGSRFSQNFSSVSTEHISCFPNVVLASVRGGLFISSKIHLFKNIFVNVKCWPNSPVFTVSINNRNWHVYIHDTSQLTCLHTAMTCHMTRLQTRHVTTDTSTAITCHMTCLQPWHVTCHMTCLQPWHVTTDTSTDMTYHNWHVYRHDTWHVTSTDVTCHNSHVYRHNTSQLTCLQPWHITTDTSTDMTRDITSTDMTRLQT